MCITFFYISPDPSSPVKFFIAFNREENVHRPTSPLNPFKEDPNIIAGRDLSQKGTWLGYNTKTLNIAFLTNYFLPFLKRNPKIKYKSRGNLIFNFLKSDFFRTETTNNGDIIEYLREIKAEKTSYQPFNLVLGNLKLMKFFYFGNLHRYNDFLVIESGLWSMCNFEMFFETMNEREEVGIEFLENLLSNPLSKEKALIIDEIASLMMGKIKDKKKRKVFQNIPFLTTLTTTILLVDHKNNGVMREITYLYRFPLVARWFALSPYDYKVKEIEIKNKLNEIKKGK